MMNSLTPPKTIGIIGAGQLGMYMCQAAKNMGYKVITFDPNNDASAHRYSDKSYPFSFDNYEMFCQFADECDVVTYEFENVNFEYLSYCEDKLPQKKEILYYANHRYREVKLAESLDIRTVKWVCGNEGRLDELKLPLIEKTCQFGYDGKGQRRIDSYEDISLDSSLIVYEYIDFDYEISVIITRSEEKTVSYPVIRNTHKNGILEMSVIDQTLSHSLAINYAKRIADAMNYIGTMAVEFFIKDNQVIFNEIAPRPHNSGHYSLVGSHKSQYQLHIEAICGLHLSDAKNYDEEIAMVNILGQHLDNARLTFNQFKTAHYFEYNKAESRVNRKMGHVVFMGNGAWNDAERFKRGINNE